MASGPGCTASEAEVSDVVSSEAAMLKAMEDFLALADLPESAVKIAYSFVLQQGHVAGKSFGPHGFLVDFQLTYRKAKEVQPDDTLVREWSASATLGLHAVRWCFAGRPCTTSSRRCTRLSRS